MTGRPRRSSNPAPPSKKDVLSPGPCPSLAFHPMIAVAAGRFQPFHASSRGNENCSANRSKVPSVGHRRPGRRARRERSAVDVSVEIELHRAARSRPANNRTHTARDCRLRSPGLCQTIEFNRTSPQHRCPFRVEISCQCTERLVMVDRGKHQGTLVRRPSRLCPWASIRGGVAVFTPVLETAAGKRVHRSTTS